jgi:hypothetical protein
MRMRTTRGFRLRWSLHLLGWAICGGLAGLVSPWLIPVGIVVFEMVILALSLWSGRRLRSQPHPDSFIEEEDEWNGPGGDDSL